MSLKSVDYIFYCCTYLQVAHVAVPLESLLFAVATLILPASYSLLDSYLLEVFQGSILPESPDQ